MKKLTGCIVVFCVGICALILAPILSAQELQIAAGSSSTSPSYTNIPFSSTYKAHFQQLVGVGLLPYGPFKLKWVGFTSTAKPSTSPGGCKNTNVWLTITVGQSQNVTEVPQLNIGPNPTVLFTGKRTVCLDGSSNDLKIPLDQIVSYVADAQNGLVVIQVDVISVPKDLPAFRIGSVANVWEVYQYPGNTDGTYLLGISSLAMTLDVDLCGQAGC